MRPIHGFGAALAVLTALLSIFSFSINPYGDTQQIVGLLILFSAMGAVYLLASILVLKTQIEASTLHILFWASIMRLVLLPSIPILETDYYRYLWDGYAITQGMNPYRYAPIEFLREPEFSESDQALNRLRRTVQKNQRAQEVLKNVNHSHIRTIYPAFSQILFALSNTFFPLSIIGWRVVVILFDGILLVCLALLLPKFGVATNRLILYAWSPLVLKETINTTHLDGIALSGFFLALLFFFAAKPGRAGAALACSVMTKLFTLPLLAIWYRRMRGLALGWFLIVLALLLFIFMLSGDQDVEGLATFAQRWESNSSLVLLFEKIWLLLGLPAWGEGPLWFEWGGVSFYWDAFMAAKLFLTGLFVMGIAYFTWRCLPHQTPDRQRLFYSFWTLGLLLICSPVANPWYIAWVTPFLCFFPYLSWALLSILCLFYYTFFVGGERTYHTWILLLEYLPFYGLLIYELIKGPILERKKKE